MISVNSFGYSVVDSMYEKHIQGTYRDPASIESKFCLITEDHQIFGKSCYSSIELCNKRLQFWQDLPGAKKHFCAKL